MGGRGSDGKIENDWSVYGCGHTMKGKGAPDTDEAAALNVCWPAAPITSQTKPTAAAGRVLTQRRARRSSGTCACRRKCPCTGAAAFDSGWLMPKRVGARGLERINKRSIEFDPRETMVKHAHKGV